MRSLSSGSTANRYLVCDIVDHQLILYDSFEGLPAPSSDDKHASPNAVGMYRGDLDDVRSAVERYGAPGRCVYRKGWFDDTLPEHSEPIVLCFLDVDFHSSIHTCLVNLWPHLHDRGPLFTDDDAHLRSSAVFFSERYWRTCSDREPPGLLAAGSGLGVGNDFTGPWGAGWRPLEGPEGPACTAKHFEGVWDCYPQDATPPTETGLGGREPEALDDPVQTRTG